MMLPPSAIYHLHFSTALSHPFHSVLTHLLVWYCQAGTGGGLNNFSIIITRNQYSFQAFFRNVLFVQFMWLRKKIEHSVSICTSQSYLLFEPLSFFLFLPIFCFWLSQSSLKIKSKLNINIGSINSKVSYSTFFFLLTDSRKGRELERGPWEPETSLSKMKSMRIYCVSRHFFVWQTTQTLICQLSISLHSSFSVAKAMLMQLCCPV